MTKQKITIESDDERFKKHIALVCSEVLDFVIDRTRGPLEALIVLQCVKNHIAQEHQIAEVDLLDLPMPTGMKQ
jgi:hypothetical protein